MHQYYGQVLAVERQEEHKPQRAKRNLAVRACCRRPAWTNRHGREACFLPPLSARICDVRNFRIPQSVDNMHPAIELPLPSSKLRASLGVGNMSIMRSHSTESAMRLFNLSPLQHSDMFGRPVIDTPSIHKMEPMELERPAVCLAREGAESTDGP